MFSWSYKHDGINVPSLVFKKLCIFGVVLMACQGKLFALCDRCAVFNNLRDWRVERRAQSGFLSWKPVKISDHAGKSRFWRSFVRQDGTLQGGTASWVDCARCISKEARCRCV